MKGPRGCSDDFDLASRLAIARYLVKSAYKAALEDVSDATAVALICEQVSAIAEEILIERGMSPSRTRKLVEEQWRNM